MKKPVSCHQGKHRPVETNSKVPARATPAACRRPGQPQASLLRRRISTAQWRVFAVVVRLEPLALTIGPPVQLPSVRMSAPKPREFLIRGITLAGRQFRPSDWSERLAGALSSFRPHSGVVGIGAHIGYSPYCVPQVIEGVRCVIVNEALRDLELMAWDFVMNFARDNELQVNPICSMPDLPPPDQGLVA
jgi:hypothetical protein